MFRSILKELPQIFYVKPWPVGTEKHYNQNKIYLNSVGRQLSVKTCTLMENQLTGSYIASKAMAGKTIGKFKIIEKYEIHYRFN